MAASFLKTSPAQITRKIFAAFPSTKSAEILFWWTAPLVLFFCALLLSYNFSDLDTLLISSFLGYFLSLRWSFYGALISAFGAGLCFFLEMTAVNPTLFLWEWGLFFTFVIQFFVTSFCIEQINFLISNREAEFLDLVEEKKQTQSIYEDEKRQWIEREDLLKSEILNLQKTLSLKIEESATLDRKLWHVVSEFNQFVENKDRIVGEASLANAEKNEMINLLEEEKKFVQELLQLNSSLEKKNLFVESTLRSLTLSFDDCQSQLIEAKNRVTEQETLLDQLKIRSEDLENVHEIKRQNQHLDHQLQIQSQMIASLTKSFEEKLHEIKQLKNQAFQIEKTTISDKQLLTLKKENQRLSGLYTQLRKQFDEKSHTLHLTRKELFQLQGKVEDEKNEQKLLAIESKQLEEIEKLIAKMDILEQEKDLLEDELNALEELISQLLSQ